MGAEGAGTFAAVDTGPTIVGDGWVDRSCDAAASECLLDVSGVSGDNAGRDNCDLDFLDRKSLEGSMCLKGISVQGFTNLQLEEREIDPTKGLTALHCASTQQGGVVLV